MNLFTQDLSGLESPANTIQENPSSGTDALIAHGLQAIAR
jgi:hypothetical protein